MPCGAARHGGPSLRGLNEINSERGVVGPRRNLAQPNSDATQKHKKASTAHRHGNPAGYSYYVTRASGRCAAGSLPVPGWWPENTTGSRQSSADRYHVASPTRAAYTSTSIIRQRQIWHMCTRHETKPFGTKQSNRSRGLQRPALMAHVHISSGFEPISFSSRHQSYAMKPVTTLLVPSLQQPYSLRSKLHHLHAARRGEERRGNYMIPHPSQAILSASLKPMLKLF